MKKTIKMLLMIIFMLSLTACGGNVKNINIFDVDSEIYSESEINAAIDIAIKHFKEYDAIIISTKQDEKDPII